MRLNVLGLHRVLTPRVSACSPYAFWGTNPTITYPEAWMKDEPSWRSPVVMKHEAGHMFGLSDNYKVILDVEQPDAIMSGGSARQPDLTEADVQSVNAAYRLNFLGRSPAECGNDWYLASFGISGTSCYPRKPDEALEDIDYDTPSGPALSPSVGADTPRADGAEDQDTGGNSAVDKRAEDKSAARDGGRADKTPVDKGAADEPPSSKGAGGGSGGNDRPRDRSRGGGSSDDKRPKSPPSPPADADSTPATAESPRAAADPWMGECPDGGSPDACCMRGCVKEARFQYRGCGIGVAKHSYKRGRLSRSAIEGGGRPYRVIAAPGKCLNDPPDASEYTICRQSHYGRQDCSTFDLSGATAFGKGVRIGNWQVRPVTDSVAP